MQPPSGGCVLKPLLPYSTGIRVSAAAFGRLCVETTTKQIPTEWGFAAAFGRLCVETFKQVPVIANLMAAAFGRLCVETSQVGYGL